FRRDPYSEGMRPAAASFASRTLFVFPIRFPKIDHVYTPNDHGLARFNRLRRVHKISPNNVPTLVIVMRLDFPWTFAALGLQAVARRSVCAAASLTKIREPGLCHSRVLYLLIDTVLIQAPRAVDADDSAEHVHLFEANVDQISKLALDILN